MIKSLILLVGLLDPMSPRAVVALKQMKTDYATCHAYWSMRADMSIQHMDGDAIKWMGRQANAGMEGIRITELLGGRTPDFYKERDAQAKELKNSLDKQGNIVVYNHYEAFCKELYDDPGGSFVKRLPPTGKQKEKMTRKNV